MFIKHGHGEPMAQLSLVLSLLLYKQEQGGSTPPVLLLDGSSRNSGSLRDDDDKNFNKIISEKWRISPFLWREMDGEYICQFFCFFFFLPGSGSNV